MSPAAPDGDRVRLARTDAEVEAALSIRRRVFVEGQGVPEALEQDGQDSEATHFVAWRSGEAVGAARLRQLGDGNVKVERVAVLPEFRGDGWGRRLMEAAEAEAADRGADRVVLHAQTAVEGFYHRLGYETVGHEFEEAGIPHVEMVKELYRSRT